MRVRDAASVANQAAGGSEFVELIDRRHRVAYGQSGKLLAPRVEERIAADHEPACMEFDKVGKDRIEVAIGARVQDVELDPELVGRRLKLSCFSHDIGPGWVDEHRDDGRGRHQLLQQLKPLRSDLHSQIGNTGEIASGPA